MVVPAIDKWCEAGEAATALMEKTGERWSEAEVYRMQAQLSSDAATAARHFDKAITIARAQGARAWEQRIRQSRSLQP